LNRLADALGSIKASATLAGATFASGLSTVVGLIPQDIGKLASFVGLILTLIMINYWRKKQTNESIQSRLDTELKMIEIEKARLSLEADRRHHARRIEDDIQP